MTRKEELNGLKTMYETLVSIPEEKRFDFFLNNSPTFRKDVTSYITREESIKVGNDCVDSEEVRLYQNYLALVALRNLAVMMYPNYSKRAEYSTRDWSYPLDVTIQG